MTAICILARLRKTLQDFTFTKAAQLCFYCSVQHQHQLSFAYALQFSSALLTLLNSANATQLTLLSSASTTQLS